MNNSSLSRFIFLCVFIVPGLQELLLNANMHVNLLHEIMNFKVTSSCIEILLIILACYFILFEKNGQACSSSFLFSFFSLYLLFLLFLEGLEPAGLFDRCNFLMNLIYLVLFLNLLFKVLNDILSFVWLHAVS